MSEDLLARAQEVSRQVGDRVREALGIPEGVGRRDDTPLRVLVVDDSRDAADTLSALLEIAGFEPHVYYDGPSALADLDRVRPEACVLDLMMPGMDGLEVARRVRTWAGQRVVPLVAVTALGDAEARRQTAAAGFDLHLTKPVHPDQLACVLADLVILHGDGGG